MGIKHGSSSVREQSSSPALRPETHKIHDGMINVIVPPFHILWYNTSILEKSVYKYTCCIKPQTWMQRCYDITERPFFPFTSISPYLNGSLPAVLSHCERLPSNSSYTKKNAEVLDFPQITVSSFLGVTARSQALGDVTILLSLFKVSKLSCEVAWSCLA